MLVPILVEVGSHWAATGNGIEIEHLLSEVIKSALSEYGSEQKQSSPSRSVVLACVGEEHHSLAIQALSVALAESGIPSTFLGASTPQLALNAIIRKSAPPRELFSAAPGGVESLVVPHSIPKT